MDRKACYCHFSFRRKKGTDYAYFAVAFYKDAEGKEQIGHVTVKNTIWENNQFVTAIQAYENALRVISELQVAMKNGGYTNVMLVTDNSILANWIYEISPRHQFYDYMMRAVANYRCGAPREIKLSVGLAEPRDRELSYKYCAEKYVIEDKGIKTKKSSDGASRIDLGDTDVVKITDLVEDDIVTGAEIVE